MIDINKLPKDTMVTNEMLDPKQGQRILVMEHPKTSYQVTRYNGMIELDAHRIYNSINHKDKIMVNALVTYSNFFDQWTNGKEFILDYKTIEVIKGGLSNEY